MTVVETPKVGKTPQVGAFAPFLETLNQEVKEAPARKRKAPTVESWFGIGMMSVANVREWDRFIFAADILGADYVFYIGYRTFKTGISSKNPPVVETFRNVSDFRKRKPEGVVIGVDSLGTKPIEKLVHPTQALYLLNPNHAGRQQCEDVVYLPTKDHLSLPVPETAALVIHDRNVKGI
jgi:hypothetical protein